MKFLFMGPVFGFLVCKVNYSVRFVAGLCRGIFRRTAFPCRDCRDFSADGRRFPTAGVHCFQAERLRRYIIRYDTIRPAHPELPYGQGKEGFKAPAGGA